MSEYDRQKDIENEGQRAAYVSKSGRIELQMTDAQARSIGKRHTPGIWKVDNPRPNHWRVVQYEGARDGREFDGLQIIAECHISDAYRPRGESEANARLIATAPKLLAALKDVLTANDFRGFLDPHYASKLQAVVSEAEGA